MRWRRIGAIVAGCAAVVALAAGCGGAEVEEDDELIVEGPVVEEPADEAYGGGPTEGAMANFEQAVQRPALYVGDKVIGQATVTDVVSDRGFWLESENARIFAIIRERDNEESPKLDVGDIVQLSGEIYPADETTVLEGQLDVQTASVLERQDYYVAVSTNSVNVVTRGVAHLPRRVPLERNPSTNE